MWRRLGAWALALVWLAAALRARLPARASETLGVETRGVAAAVLYEAPIAGGSLPELEGRYKLRVTEVAIAPGGFVGDHGHLGPGIRQMTSGELEFVARGAATTYRAGDFFFEPGGVSHRILNMSGAASTHLVFELLPAGLEGPSVVPPKSKAR